MSDMNAQPKTVRICCCNGTIADPQRPRATMACCQNFVLLPALASFLDGGERPWRDGEPE